jgi:predicted chitinase/cell wall-associated NlpC family hydrolase
MGLDLRGKRVTKINGQVPPVAPVAGGGRGAARGNQADRFINAALTVNASPQPNGAKPKPVADKPGPADGSGLLREAGRAAGLNLEGSAAEQQKLGRPVDLKALQPGDVVFKGQPATQSGIYLGNDQVLQALQAGEPAKIVSVKGFDHARRLFDEPAQAIAPQPNGAVPAPAPAVEDYQPIRGSGLTLGPDVEEKGRQERAAARGGGGGGGGTGGGIPTGGGAGGGAIPAGVGAGGGGAPVPALGAPQPLPADWQFPLGLEELARVLNVPVAELQQSLPYIVQGMKEAGITDPNAIIGILATVKTEVSNFQPIREYASGQDYEGRADLGNTQPGDGVRFKGRGFIQITGRANYREYGRKLGIDLEGNPDLALRPDVAAKILVQYFKDRGLDQKAAAGDWSPVRKGVNGGFNGMDTFMATVNKLTDASRQKLA